MDQKLKMSQMLMAIFVAYSKSGITSGEKFLRDLQKAALSKMSKY